MSFLTSPYYLGQLLSTAALYMTAGCGAAICIKSGEFNLGSEGQIYAGGFISAILLNALKNGSAFPSVLLAFVAAALGSALIAEASALLKKFRNADFLLTSFIISSGIIPLIDGLISGPFRSSGENLLATPFISPRFRFSSLLPPSTFNAYFFAALAVCILGGVFLFKTDFGGRLLIFGRAGEFALYSGYSEKAILFSAAGISGALNGITGAAAVCGTYFTCHSGFYSGTGWNALSVALLAGSNPFLIAPAAVFISLTMTTASYTALYHNFGFDISSLIQAVIIFIASMPIARNIGGRGRKK